MTARLHLPHPLLLKPRASLELGLLSSSETRLASQETHGKREGTFWFGLGGSTKNKQKVLPVSFGKGKEKSEEKKKTASLLSVSLSLSLESQEEREKEKRKRRTKDSPRRRRQQRVGERRRSAVVGRVGGSSVRVSQRRKRGRTGRIRT